jgi:hypothetical protein
MGKVVFRVEMPSASVTSTPLLLRKEKSFTGFRVTMTVIDIPEKSTNGSFKSANMPAYAITL